MPPNMLCTVNQLKHAKSVFLDKFVSFSRRFKQKQPCDVLYRNLFYSNGSTEYTSSTCLLFSQQVVVSSPVRLTLEYIEGKKVETLLTYYDPQATPALTLVSITPAGFF
jgi:hypothetical protein